MYHFVEEGFVCRAQRFPDQAYSDILDGIVVGCSDCALVCDNEMLLGRRTDEPAKGFLWVIGGRMTPGEDPRETVRKVAVREVGLEIPNIEDILDLNSTGSYVFATRSQEPKGHGCHMLGLNHCFRIKKGDKARLANQPDNPNFSEFLWQPVRSMINNPEYHFGIQNIAKAVHNRLGD